MFLFLLFGRGGGGSDYVFAVWAGSWFCFCCLGGGVFFFFAVWARDGSSLTNRSAWLGFKAPNNKKTKQTKKNTGSGHHHQRRI